MMHNPQSRFRLNPTGPEPELLEFIALSLSIHWSALMGIQTHKQSFLLLDLRWEHAHLATSNSLSLLHVHDDCEGIASVDLEVKNMF